MRWVIWSKSHNRPLEYRDIFVCVINGSLSRCESNHTFNFTDEKTAKMWLEQYKLTKRIDQLDPNIMEIRYEQ